MAHLTWIRRFLWVIPVVLGLVFIVAGAYMIVQGLDAKDDVRTQLAAEKIISAEDASIPNAPVDDVATARSQAAVIKQHSLERSGGKTYAEMDREDPNRATYLTGVTLRSALNLAVMGFKVSDLVIGMGAFVVVIGASHVFLLAPLTFWVLRPEPAPPLARARPGLAGSPG